MPTLGAITKFHCATHGTQEVYARTGEYPPCNTCGKRMNAVAPSRKTIGLPYDKPVYSVAAGVQPNQVAEHRRVHPEIPITDDGCVVFTDHYQRKKILKKLGMIDRDGF
jgi:hypothetical protein